MKTEVWKQSTHKGYSVSNLGRIRNDNSGKFLKPWNNEKGYKLVSLNKRKVFVHRAVAEVWINNPDKKPFIDHINTRVDDNRVENLRWVTAKENSHNPLTLSRVKKTSFKEGDENPKTMTGKYGALNPRSRSVIQMKRDGTTVQVYECAREAMRMTGVACSTITKCCRGQRKTAGGFCWTYQDEAL